MEKDKQKKFKRLSGVISFTSLHVKVVTMIFKISIVQAIQEVFNILKLIEENIRVKLITNFEWES